MGFSIEQAKERIEKCRNYDAYPQWTGPRKEVKVGVEITTLEGIGFPMNDESGIPLFDGQTERTAYVLNKRSPILTTENVSEFVTAVHFELVDLIDNSTNQLQTNNARKYLNGFVTDRQAAASEIQEAAADMAAMSKDQVAALLQRALAALGTKNRKHKK